MSNKKSQCIYKYYTFEDEYSISNIENNIVYLSIPSEFNDPYDCLICIDDIDIQRNKYINYIKMGSLPTNKKEELIEKIKVSNSPIEIYYDFVEKDNGNTGFAAYANDSHYEFEGCNGLKSHSFKQRFKISCFSKTNNDNVLWSHYANKHTGFCIEYNISKLDKDNDLKKHLFLVKYKKNPLKIKNSKERGQIIKEYFPLVLSKHISWKYEKEIRLIKTDTEDRKYKLPVNPSRIYAGAMISVENYCKLMHLHIKKDIPISRCQICPDSYSLNFKDCSLSLKRRQELMSNLTTIKQPILGCLCGEKKEYKMKPKTSFEAIETNPAKIQNAYKERIDAYNTSIVKVNRDFVHEQTKSEDTDKKKLAELCEYLALHYLSLSEIIDSYNGICNL